MFEEIDMDLEKDVRKAPLLLMWGLRNFKLNLLIKDWVGWGSVGMMTGYIDWVESSIFFDSSFV
jgi:hypothetical protein